MKEQKKKKCCKGIFLFHVLVNIPLDVLLDWMGQEGVERTETKVDGGEPRSASGNSIISRCLSFLLGTISKGGKHLN